MNGGRFENPSGRGADLDPEIEEGIVLKLSGYGLLDTDGVHAHYQGTVPVRRLHCHLAFIPRLALRGPRRTVNRAAAA